MLRRLTFFFVVFLGLTLCVACSRKEDVGVPEDSDPAGDTPTHLKDRDAENGEAQPSVSPSPSKAEAIRDDGSPGPRKIARPAQTAPSGADVSPKHAQPEQSSQARDGESGHSTAKPSSAKSSSEGARSGETGVDEASEDTTRRFDFDGSDEELEMILGTRPIPPFYIDDLLTVRDLRASLGAHTPSEIGILEGQSPSPYYNHRWFRAGDGERMGVVFQYWHFQTPNAAQIHYNLMEEMTAVASNAVGVASQAHYTVQAQTTSLVALSLKVPAVIALTCDVETCHVPQLMHWIQLIETRAQE